MKPAALLLDLDGTVHRGGKPTPSAAEILLEAVSRGIALRYLTNNSTVRPSEVAAQLAGWGVPCESGWVYSTAPEAARLLVTLGASRVFVVGEPALTEAVLAVGLEVVDEEGALAGQADHVVQGLCRDLTYRSLRAAHRALQRGAGFVATNRDLTFPVEGGWLDPGSGVTTAALAAASGRQPTCVGKPAPLLVERACVDLGFDPGDVLVVGDRMDTDIEAGRAAGAPTWLVLTGVERAVPAGQDGSPDLTGLRSLWS